MLLLREQPGWNVLRKIMADVISSTCQVRDPQAYKDYATQRPFYDGMIHMNQVITEIMEEAEMALQPVPQDIAADEFGY